MDEVTGGNKKVRFSDETQIEDGIESIVDQELVEMDINRAHRCWEH